MTFDKCFELTVKAEGGYVNDPTDLGSETIYGISRKHHPDSTIWKYVDKWKERGMTPYEINKMAKSTPEFIDFVKAIYRGGYWASCKCDKLNSKYHLPMFNCAVNIGVKNASKLFQRALGVPDDGIIGKQSINKAYISSPKIVLEKFYANWEWYYDQVVSKRPEQAKFRKGWHNRIEQVKKDNCD
jgi:lysozyme family protein